LGAYCSSKYGLRTTALLGGSLTLLSCLVRYVVILAYAASALNATQAYALVLIGQSIGALSQVLCSEQQMWVCKVCSDSRFSSTLQECLQVTGSQLR
jgi:hypothetical protein